MSDDPPALMPDFDVVVRPDSVVDQPSADAPITAVQLPRLISKRQANVFLRHFRDVAKSREDGAPLPPTPAELSGIHHSELVRLCEASVVFINMAIVDPALNLDDEMKLRYRTMIHVMGRWIFFLNGHDIEADEIDRICNLVSSIIARSAEIVEM